MMKVTKEQQKIKHRISELKTSILSSIDKICENHNYDVTYLEINTALTEVLKSNLNWERKEYLKSKENEEN